MPKKTKSTLFLVREPNGRRSRSQNQEPEACSPAQVRRLRDAAVAGMCDAEWGTELGRLFLQGKISAPQYAAGKWWAGLAVRARKAIDAPKEAPTKSAFVKGLGGHDPDPDSEAGQQQAARDREAVMEFMAAHGALIGAGMLAERAVRMVCEDRKTVETHLQLLSLGRGLEWLHEYRDLTQRTKNVR